MVKLMSMMAAVALLGMTACGVEAQPPDEAQKSEPQKSEPQAPVSRPVVLPQNAPGGGCYSYCDDRYCYICRTWPDGSCGCILD